MKLIYSDRLYDNIILNDIKRILLITQIYHLNISKTPISLGLLIQILNILPDVLTLKIYSLTADRNSRLTLEEYCNFKKRKIRNVYIEVMNNIKYVPFFLVHFPCMQYFQVKHLINMNIQIFLQYIFDQIIYHNDQYLQSLCLHQITINDQTIEYLQQIKKYQQLLVDFTIKHINNYIYLQWK